MLRLYREATDMVLSDENVDCLTVVLYEAPFTALQQYHQIVQVFNDSKRFVKPITIWLYGTRLSLMRELSLLLEDSGFPVYFNVILPVKALDTAVKYSTYSPFSLHN